jgi:flagellar hook protein FlgE
MLAAVSGIDANQTYLDAVANNIANADTVGYKSEDVQFQDLLSEQLSSGTAPPASGGAGVDPLSIGAGTQVTANTVDLSEGTLEDTGQSTDMAIQGNGYFIAENNGAIGYTRDGSLELDGDGNLSTLEGGLIQGWQANAAGVVNTNTPTTGIQIPQGETIPANATSTFGLTGNLPAWNGVGTPPTATTVPDAYDALGDSIPVTLTFTGVADEPNEWTVTGSVQSPSGTTEQLWASGDEPIITFNAASGEVEGVTINGTAVTPASNGSYSLPVGTMPSGYTFPSGDKWTFTLPSGTSSSALTQFAGEQTVAVSGQDGHASGSLESWSVDGNGVITGSFSDGTTLTLGQIALASFSNPGGLVDEGDGMFTAGPNSGQAQIGTAQTGGRGELLGGELEQSNVNLGTELTDLISAQESYDANTKVLTTSQDVIQQLEEVA